MKLKVLIATLFVAGFASSFALAGGTKGAADTTTGTTTGATTGAATTGKTTTGTTTTGTTTAPTKAEKCKKVELQGSNGSGSVSFTVDKSSKQAKSANGTAVTLTIAGAKVRATACVDAAGALTLSQLELSIPKAKKDDASGKQDDADKTGGDDKQKGKSGK